MNHYDEIDYDEHAAQRQHQTDEHAAETAYERALENAARIGREHGEHETARECWQEAQDSPESPWVNDVAGQARYYLSETLRSEYSDAMPDLGACVWADLLNGAFSAIDWREIADNALAEVARETGFFHAVTP